MFYTTIEALLNDVINYAEDTQASDFGDSTERFSRLAHYYDQTVAEICGDRPWWPFLKSSSNLTLSSGAADLPAAFGGIGIDGYVIITGSRNLPWVEVSFQELVAIRNNTVWPAYYQHNRVYAIGSSSTAGRVAVWSAKADDDRSITVYHDVELGRVDVNTIDSTAPALPSYLHEALLLGTVWKAALAKNDERAPEFYRQFMGALAKGARAGRPKGSRPSQLPQTVGGMY